MKVLIVEDNPFNLKVLDSLMRNRGYATDFAVNGLFACEKVQKTDYDLILMDVQMPVMDGLTATREIRKQSPDDKQPYIIAITANAMGGDRKMCIDAGMNDYIAKPVTTASLDQALAKLVPEHSFDPSAVDEEKEILDFDPKMIYQIADPDNPEQVRMLLAELWGHIQKAYQDYRRLVADACANRDAQGLDHVLHQMKGSCGSVGLMQLSAFCAENLQRVRAGTFTDYATFPMEMEKQYESGKKALWAFMEGLEKI